MNKINSDQRSNCLFPSFVSACLLTLAFQTADVGAISEKSLTPIFTTGVHSPPSIQATDVSIDEDGYVYITSMLDKTFSKHDASGELIWKVKDFTGTPRRIQVSGDRLYVTNTTNSSLRFYDTSGTFLSNWKIANFGVNSIDASDVHGLLAIPYVASSFGASIYDLDLNIIHTIEPEYPKPKKAENPTDIKILPDGSYLMAFRGNSRIDKYSPGGVLAWSIGSRGSGAGEFEWLSGIDIDSVGNIYAVDRRNHRIQKFSPDGDFIAEWGTYGDDPGQFMEPAGVAVGPDDTIWVANYHGNNIQRFDADGNFLAIWDGGVSGDGEFTNALGVAVVDGKLFVVDNKNNRVQVFDSGTGEFLYKFGQRGDAAEAGYNYPRAITISDSGEVYVTNDKQVVRTNQDGELIQRYEAAADGNFGGARGIAIDESSGAFYQLDTRNDIVYKRHIEDGNVASSFGGMLLDQPQGIALLEDSIYVSDTNNSAIRIFDMDTEELISTWLLPYAPFGLSADGTREILYVASGNQVHAYNYEGDELFFWDLPFNGGKFLSVDENGHLFITNSKGTIAAYSPVPLPASFALLGSTLVLLWAKRRT